MDSQNLVYVYVYASSNRKPPCIRGMYVHIYQQHIATEGFKSSGTKSRCQAQQPCILIYNGVDMPSKSMKDIDRKVNDLSAQVEKLASLLEQFISTTKTPTTTPKVVVQPKVVSQPKPLATSTNSAGSFITAYVKEKTGNLVLKQQGRYADNVFAVIKRYNTYIPNRATFIKEAKVVAFENALAQIGVAIRRIEDPNKDWKPITN